MQCDAPLVVRLGYEQSILSIDYIEKNARSRQYRLVYDGPSCAFAAT
jgi:hypothetical protein